MSLFKQLVNRGNAVIREWYTNEGINESSRMMIAELAATTFINMYGSNMGEFTPQERQDRVNAIRIALTASYQIGKATTPKRRKKDRKA